MAQALLFSMAEGVMSTPVKLELEDDGPESWRMPPQTQDADMNDQLHAINTSTSQGLAQARKTLSILRSRIWHIDHGKIKKYSATQMQEWQRVIKWLQCQVAMGSQKAAYTPTTHHPATTHSPTHHPLSAPTTRNPPSILHHRLLPHESTRWARY